MRILALVATLACGCSALLTRSSPRLATNTCTGYAPAVIDTLVTSTLVALAVRSYRDNHCTREDGCHTFDPTGLFVLPILVTGLSSLHGFSTETTCREKAASAPPVVQLADEP